MTSNETYYAYICFSGVKTDEEDMDDGVYCWRKVKTSNNGFCLDTLEKLMNK